MVIRDPLASYDRKMTYKWGDFYIYMLMIRQNTPENSIIYIPPMRAPWGLEGNEGLVRGFLFPRIIRPFDKNKITNEQNSFVLLVQKEGTWPAVSLKSKYVISFDLQSKQVKKLSSQNYSHKNNVFKIKPGLIKL